MEKAVVKTGASIGSGTTIQSNVVIGATAIGGARKVVTKVVPADVVVRSDPARLLRSVVAAR